MRMTKHPPSLGYGVAGECRMTKRIGKQTLQKETKITKGFKINPQSLFPSLPSVKNALEFPPLTIAVSARASGEALESDEVSAWE